MAVLRINDLSLEIAYRDFEHGWVSYDIWLRWRGVPVINDVILKRSNEYWSRRGVGAIKADEYRQCGIVPLLRKALDSNESDYWEATDPDILLAVYMNDSFPFLPPKWTVVYESPQAMAAREQREAQRAACGPLPDDYVEVLLFVDAYNFEGAHGYCGNGLCFRMIPRRAVLAKFYEDLRREYVAFKERHPVDTYDLDDFGPDGEIPT